MNKKYIILIVVAFILTLLALILLIPEVEYRDDVEYEENNTVVNRTSKTYLEDITHLGLNYLNINGTTVIIKEISRDVDIDGEYSAKATIVTNGLQYQISIFDLKKAEALKVLAHELIHLEQYECNELKIVDVEGVPYIYFKQDVWSLESLDNIPYMERPWEIDAFKRQGEVIDYLKEIILVK